MAGPEASERIESTFNRIAVGSRVVAAVWMLALGAVTLVRGVERPAVAVAGLMVAVIWAGSSVWIHARTPSAMLDPSMLAVDAAVAVASVIAAGASGTTISFYGGLPLIVVGITALKSQKAALAVATGLAIVQLSTLGVKTMEQVVDQLTLILAYVGIALLVSWIVGVLRNSQSELERANAAAGEARAAAVREAERAEISRHLHDSVLQTLALIQRNSGDAREVTLQARRQERELREWLFGERPDTLDGGVFEDALRAAAASIEQRFGVSIDVVCVGSAPLSEPVGKLVSAATQAMVNAAEHSGVGEIDVYGEAGDRTVTVFVRDRGRGFDPEAVPAGRHGVKDSIVGRMASVGGEAHLRTDAGKGTEWSLSVDIEDGG